MKRSFLGKNINDNQQIVCILGPSGTGKTFSAEFLQENFGYKIIQQITTRDKRQDDKYYEFISREDFVRLQNNGKIFGFFDGDLNTIDGNGYGYYKDYVFEQLNKYKKIIIFPSVYELLDNNFKNNYGSAVKIGLAFKNSKRVTERAIQANKEMPLDELTKRVKIATSLSLIMEKYNETKGDDNFHIIYSDILADNINDSKKIQLQKILSIVGVDNKTENLNDKLEEYVREK